MCTHEKFLPGNVFVSKKKKPPCFPVNGRFSMRIIFCFGSANRSFPNFHTTKYALPQKMWNLTKTLLAKTDIKRTIKMENGI